MVSFAGPSVGSFIGSLLVIKEDGDGLLSSL